MADRWAVATGNWSDTATWDGGTLPGTTDDVYADGFTVTVDTDVTAASVRTTQRTGGTAGGGFSLSHGVTLTANVIAGTSICVTYAGSGTNQAYIVGDVTGGVSVTGVNKIANAGTLNITGTVTGGSGSTGHGVQNAGATASTVNILGDVYGGTGTTTCMGANNNSSGILNITGNVYGGTGTSSYGARNNNIGTMTITGNVYGASSGNSYGVQQISTGTTTINGDVHSTNVARGVQNAGSTAKIIINGNIIVDNGATMGAIDNTSTGIISVSGNFVSNADGYAAMGAKFLCHESFEQGIQFATDAGSGTVGSLRTLYVGIPVGGNVAAGAGVDTLNFSIYNNTGSGGTVVGGEIQPQSNYNSTMSGGSVCGGTATFSVISGLCKTGTILSPTSTGNQTYTTTGFNATPTAVLLWTTTRPSDDITTGSRFGIGLATASSQFAIGVTVQDGQTVSNAQRMQVNDKVVYISIDSNVTLFLVANLVSFGQSGTDGQFTLNWTTVDSTPQILNYMVFGGNAEVNLLEILSYASTGEQSYAHGLSGGPTGLISFNTGSTGVPPSLTTHAQMGIGFWAGATSYCSHILSQDNLADSNAWRRFDSQFIRAGGNNNNAANPTVDKATVSAVDNTNVTLSWTHDEDATSAGGRYVWIVAMRGIQARVGTFNTPTVGTSQSVTGLAMTPSALLLMSPMGATSASPVDDLRFMFSGEDGTNHNICGILDQDAQATSNADRFQDSDKSIKIYDHSQVIQTEGFVPSFKNDGFDISYSSVGATSYEIGYMAFGEYIPGTTYNETASGGVVASATNNYVYVTERWAIATGNWSDTTIWNDGALPSTDAVVYANGFTVTINQNVNVRAVKTKAGAVAAAGGGFVLSSGFTLTADVQAGTTTCVTFSANSPGTATINGNVTGTSDSVSVVHGILQTGSGTLTINGNITGGSGSFSDYGANNDGSGIMNINGNITGGTGASSNYGASNSANGEIHIVGDILATTAAGFVNGSTGIVSVTGDVTGGTTGGSAYGLRNASSGQITITGAVNGGTGSTLSVGVYNQFTGTIIINTGPVTGGSATTAIGAYNKGTGLITINSNVIGGSTSDAYGAWNDTTGTITITGNVTGTSSYGLYNSSTGTINITGDVTGGSATSIYGVYNSAAGTVNVIGNVTGGSNGTAWGIANYNNGSSNGIVNITGNVTGGSFSTATGLMNRVAGTTTINGNVFGTAAFGVENADAGAANPLVTINGNVTGGSGRAGVRNGTTGHVIINGDATGGTGNSAVSNEGAGRITINGDFIADSSGYFVMGGKILINSSNPQAFKCRINSSDLPGRERGFYTSNADPEVD